MKPYQQLQFHLNRGSFLTNSPLMLRPLEGAEKRKRLSAQLQWDPVRFHKEMKWYVDGGGGLTKPPLYNSTFP